MRDKITEKLLEIDNRIYYGLVPENEDIKVWDYFVFGQKKIRKKDVNSTDLQGYWYVTIVRENYIPDDLLGEVINKISEIAGLRLTMDEFEYEYTTKGSTDIVVEILELQFTKTKTGVLSA